MFDPVENAVHDAAASRRFPGPDYYAVLQWIHEELRPATYVEIGVGYGESLKLASPPTVALGIDEEPRADHSWRADTRIVPLSSAEFFRTHDLKTFLAAGHFSFAFIDGLHLYEQVLADFSNLERYASAESLIAIHDTIPLDEKTSARQRTTEFYTGDVWRIVPHFRDHRPDLEVVTVRTAPAGLTLIRGFGGNGARENPQAGELANDREAVTGWLRRASASTRPSNRFR